MHIGMVGLGRMGGNMAERLRDAGIQVTGYDANPENTEVATLAELAATLPGPRRVVWVMVPAGPPTAAVLEELAGVLEDGDIVVEGGNSHFEEDRENAETLAERGIRYVDVGVSGGIWGRENGYGLMAGGDADDIEHLMPVFDALRPEGPREEGFVHAGPVGAGHYAKMVHNGIEYGLMQAYAEGYQLLEARDDLIPDVGAVFGAWRRGTVVRSWLLDLMVRAVEEDPGLDDISGWVDDSGEGRWTIIEAIDAAVPVPVISSALFARFSSRQPNSPAMRAVAALRKQFGGHAVHAADGAAKVATPPGGAAETGSVAGSRSGAGPGSGASAAAHGTNE
ncbi:6-phosphogluconate dehydrogenase (decarboxylating) [Georgenia soli]|uniref:6-phosphogluconate dehydrogenase (Decarboxylating) n=1 Tax=Georgenia soli TaxID=638953 RepID=A0A2A9ENG4_9MICO|nr:decarboxylating 6-phosphogluconate dehydrogenase [Georgenia soli]PFG39780.1 6-phosphogluconate dehydrogenase (decarboxylating) [Georgenia soli]